MTTATATRKFTRTCSICGQIFDGNKEGKPYISDIYAQRALSRHMTEMHSKVKKNGAATSPAAVAKAAMAVAARGTTPAPASSSGPFTAKCDECGKVLERDATRKEPFPSQHKADLALRLHKARAHGGMMAPGQVDESGVKAKRKYTKRQKLEQHTVDTEVNFCPRCGCNLAKVALGMAMGQ